MGQERRKGSITATNYCHGLVDGILTKNRGQPPGFAQLMKLGAKGLQANRCPSFKQYMQTCQTPFYRLQEVPTRG